MATATVYTVKDNQVVDEFDCDYNFAVGAYFGKHNNKGAYYIAKKGVDIPYEKKNRLLKKLYPSSQAQE